MKKMKPVRHLLLSLILLLFCGSPLFAQDELYFFEADTIVPQEVVIDSLYSDSTVVRESPLPISEDTLLFLDESAVAGMDSIASVQADTTGGVVLDSVGLNHVAIDSLKTKNLLKLVNTEEIDISPRARALLEAAIKARENFSKYQSFDDTIIVNPLFLPIVFDGGVYPENFQIYRAPGPKRPNRFVLPSDGVIERALAQDSMRMKERYKAIITNPRAIRYESNSLPQVPTSKKIHNDRIQSVDRILSERPIIQPLAINAPKVSYWVAKLKSNLSFSQVAYSEHYGSGQDNMNIRSQQDFSVGYNPFRRFTFSLTAQWVLNVNNAPEDTLRSMRIIEDKFIVNAAIGLKAFKHWAYTLNTRLETQLFNNYPANSKEKSSALLAPGNFTLGLGMTYSFKSKNNKLTFSCAPQPLSYNVVFVTKHSGISPSRYGIEDGYSLSKIGSTFDGKLTWQLLPEVQYITSIWYFTNYESVSARWQNQFSFTINRLMNATLTFNADYYDMTRTKEEGYVQYMEAVSLGLSYVW